MDFYHFFSFSAKNAIYRSSELCAQFKNQHLEPEHILYSILNLSSCSGMQVLNELGVNVPKLTYSVEAYLYERAGQFSGTAAFSARTLSLLDNSFKEVKRLHHREIGTSHLLIALAQDKSSFLHELFAEHDLDAKKIRNTYTSHLKGFQQHVPREEPSAEKLAHGAHAAEETRTAVQEQMFDMRLREILWLAAYLAKRLKHGEIDLAHVMYALSTRDDGLKLIEEAYGLSPLKPSRVLMALAGELDELPLSESVERQVPHGKQLRKTLTKAFETALDSGSAVMQFADFSRLFLAATKKQFKPLLEACELGPDELPAPSASPDDPGGEPGNAPDQAPDNDDNGDSNGSGSSAGAPA